MARSLCITNLIIKPASVLQMLRKKKMLCRLCSEATGAAGLSSRAPFILRGNRRGRNTNISHFNSVNITIRLRLAALQKVFTHFPQK